MGKHTVTNVLHIASKYYTFAYSKNSFISTRGLHILCLIKASTMYINTREMTYTLWSVWPLKYKLHNAGILPLINGKLTIGKVQSSRLHYYTLWLTCAELIKLSSCRKSYRARVCDVWFLIARCNWKQLGSYLISCDNITFRS
jgi:hypothetical protein